MDTQIALGNLASQPDYKRFVVKKYIDPALAMKQAEIAQLLRRVSASLCELFRDLFVRTAPK